MKLSIILLFVSMLTLSLSFSGCDKEDEDKKNQFTYNGKEYELDKGIIVYYGMYNESPASYNYDLTLLSPGFQVDANGNLSGEGDAVYFEMFSSSETELLPGTYNFDANETYNANTFDYGIIVIKYNITNETYEVQKTYTSGTVKVEKEGSTYEITIDCVASDGKEVKGYYKGSLTMFDESEWTAKSEKVNKSVFNK